MTAIAQRHVSDLVSEDPRRAVVFERVGIDYCCGGKMPLAQACEEHGIDLAKMEQELAHATSDATSVRSWADASIEELVSNIQEQHHANLKTELPRVAMLAEKVARAHGAFEATLVEANGIVDELVEELTAHTANEDDNVFPRCLEAADGEMGPVEASELTAQLAQLIREHDHAGGHLAELRTLLGDFVPPEHACTSWRAYLDALKRLELDTHEHVHKENHILFPKVIEQLSAQPA